RCIGSKRGMTFPAAAIDAKGFSGVLAEVGDPLERLVPKAAVGDELRRKDYVLHGLGDKPHMPSFGDLGRKCPNRQVMPEDAVFVERLGDHVLAKGGENRSGFTGEPRKMQVSQGRGWR